MTATVAIRGGSMTRIRKPVQLICIDCRETRWISQRTARRHPLRCVRCHLLHRSQVATGGNDVYRMVSGPAHPRARHGWVLEHIVIAEQVLGRYLDIKTHVHHVDGNGRNNSNANLVICENCSYHRLLHARMRIIAAGGDPDIQKICSQCKQLVLRSEYYRSKHSSDGLHTICKTCKKSNDIRRRLCRAAPRLD
jgi:hypothetical protein